MMAMGDEVWMGRIYRLLEEQQQRNEINDKVLFRLLGEIESHLRPRISATLTITANTEDNNMKVFKDKSEKESRKSLEKGAALVVGGTGQCNWQEWDGPNGTGNKVPSEGQVSFTSSDPSIATVDASSGLVTAVGPGTVTITGTDAANGLTATDSSDVPAPVAKAQSATLTITAN